MTSGRPDSPPPATRSQETRAHRGGFLGYVVQALRAVEDGVHVVVALLLVLLAIVLLIDVVDGMIIALRGPYRPVDLVLSILDRTLVLFIVAELLHTVRITITEQHLQAEPFLIVGLIAGVRRLLLVTAEAERSFHWNPQGIELLILMALILAMAVAILLLRRWPSVEEQRGTD
jgi:uncharacterized membrane protein (DUF373 family)